MTFFVIPLYVQISFLYTGSPFTRPIPSWFLLLLIENLLQSVIVKCKVLVLLITLFVSALKSAISISLPTSITVACSDIICLYSSGTKIVSLFFKSFSIFSENSIRRNERVSCNWKNNLNLNDFFGGKFSKSKRASSKDDRVFILSCTAICYQTYNRFSNKSG